MKKILLAVFVTLLLSSCSGYKAPICTDKNRTDVPNLEGKFSIQAAVLQNDESTLLRQEFNISRIARGQYITQNKQALEFSTCEIEGQAYAEVSGKIAVTEAKYLSAYKLNRNGDGSFDLVMLGADTNVLKSKNIPYEIVQVTKASGSGEDCVTKPGEATKCELTKQVVIDNSKLTPEELMQVLDPLSVQLRWTPETMRVSALSQKPGK